MKVRILQRKDDEGWYGDAYALENDSWLLLNSLFKQQKPFDSTLSPI